MIYLYVKTHRKTGLKYLGKTSRADPYSYPGSGKRWKSHLEKYGYDFDTQILTESESPEEIKKAGLYYSDKWDIVNSKEWANLKPESGDGGPFSHRSETKEKISNMTKGRDNPHKGMTYEEIQKDSEKAKERKENHKKWMADNNPYRGKKHSDEVREKMKDAASKRLNLTEDERKQRWGQLKGKPWSEARRLAQQNRKK